MNIPIFSLYRLKETGETDSNLANLISKSSTVTLNTKSKTGFDEIEIVPIEYKMPKEYRYLLHSCEKNQTNFKLLIDNMLRELEYTMHFILAEPGKKIMFMSAGADSRILAWVIKSLEKKFGSALTANLKFVCHHPEGDLFKRAMEQMGWPEEKYHVHGEGVPQSADYYNYGDFTLNMNSFDAPALNFWSDIIPRGEEKEYTLITGSFGGELLSYPLYKPGGLSENRYDHIGMWLEGYGFDNAHVTTLWKNVYVPYLSYNYLDVAFSIAPELYTYYDHTAGPESIDNIRRTILDSFGDAVPINIGHVYDFTMSEGLSQYIEKSWLGSKFYRDFKGLKEVAGANPGYAARGSIDSKLYGLATMYENTTR